MFGKSRNNKIKEIRSMIKQYCIDLSKRTIHFPEKNMRLLSQKFAEDETIINLNGDNIKLNFALKECLGRFDKTKQYTKPTNYNDLLRKYLQDYQRKEDAYEDFLSSFDKIKSCNKENLYYCLDVIKAAQKHLKGKNKESEE